LELLIERCLKTLTRVLLLLLLLLLFIFAKLTNTSLFIGS